METKDLIGLTLLGPSLLGCAGLLLLSPRAREAALFLLAAGTVLGEKLSLTFFCQYWYRGTTRGFEVTVLDLLAFGLLVSALARPRPGSPRWFWPAGLGPMLLFLAYCGFSVASGEPKLYGLFELSKMVRALLIFLAGALFIRGEREQLIVVCGLACAVALEAILALEEHFLKGVYRITGTLDHPNSVSMFLCLVGPVLLATAISDAPRLSRWLCGGAFLGASGTTLLTLSRAGIPIFGLLALGVALRCLSWRITLRKLAVVAAVGVGLLGLVAKSWESIKQRFETSTIASEYGDEHAESRAYYLRQALVIVEDRPLGVGLNNWSYWVSKEYGAKLDYHYEDYDNIDLAPSKDILPSISYAAPAHNLGALTVGELGWPGLALFALVWLRWLQVGVTFLGRRTPRNWGRRPFPPRTARASSPPGVGSNLGHRLGVGLFFGTCGVFLQSLFEWIYHQTPILLAFHLLLGMLAGLYYAQRRARRPQPHPRAQACPQPMVPVFAAVGGHR